MSLISMVPTDRARFRHNMTTHDGATRLHKEYMGTLTFQWLYAQAILALRFVFLVKTLHP